MVDAVNPTVGGRRFWRSYEHTPTFTMTALDAVCIQEMITTVPNGYKSKLTMHNERDEFTLIENFHYNVRAYLKTEGRLSQPTCEYALSLQHKSV